MLPAMQIEQKVVEPRPRYEYPEGKRPFGGRNLESQLTVKVVLGQPDYWGRFETNYDRYSR